eukprot:GEMP01006506.1.p1 GENE.GEMP01006506.1~~GEMP01006506.1.p1  ORF type:complete len:612 (+),score=116.26 GEMP01006506.1:58-1893(+)
MARIVDKIRKHLEETPEKPFFSFEYFPPKSEIGTINLYERFDRMAQLNPMWVDVTWGAGGSTAQHTFDICHDALKFRGLDVMMHLTCTNMPEEKLREALDKCKEAGICNILALRGDAPDGDTTWAAIDGGFQHATQLVRYIRAHYGDFFSIGVAGYPEGHLECDSPAAGLQHLKEKVDAGADLIVTQLFYDNNEFFEFEKKCREMGITVPILPGIMPIQSYQGFRKMTDFCKTKIPPFIDEALEPIKDDERKVKDFGVEYGIKMCRELLQNGVSGLHFYTLNLETSVCRILEGLQLVEDWHSSRELPWRPMKHKHRTSESVRPIFWANRPSSYVKRTDTWDDYPNGRFGNKDSPAYGEAVFVSYGKESMAKIRTDRRAMWGQPESCSDVAQVFVKFLKNEVKKLPWCQESPSKETNYIYKQVVKLNSIGCFTTNSQPRVNAALSTDPSVGWGPVGGFVYQKAYIEFFLEKERLIQLMRLIETERLNSWTIQAVNRDDHWESNTDSLKGVNAVTWGVFPNSEIIQPTVVDTQSFLAWKTEAFELWNEWIQLYDENSKSHELLSHIRDTYFLVSIVDNDFCSGDLFTILVKLMEETWGDNYRQSVNSNGSLSI